MLTILSAPKEHCFFNKYLGQSTWSHLEQPWSTCFGLMNQEEEKLVQSRLQFCHFAEFLSIDIIAQNRFRCKILHLIGFDDWMGADVLQE